MEKVIVILMELNLQRLFVQMIQMQNTSWKITYLKCEDCEYTTKGELYLVKHSTNLHNQFVECGLALPYSSSLELYRKAKYCNNCGKSVNFYWNRKHKNMDTKNMCVDWTASWSFTKTIVIFSSSPNWAYANLVS